MRILTLIILCFAFTNCSRYSCPDSVDVNRNLYKRYLIILNESKHSRKLVLPKEVEEATSFIEIVSGINSKAQIDNVMTYRNKADYKNDIKKWEQWYKENKCKLTIQYVDSSLKSVGLKL
jgi:hypothetical protein